MIISRGLLRPVDCVRSVTRSRNRHPTELGRSLKLFSGFLHRRDCSTVRAVPFVVKRYPVLCHLSMRFRDLWSRFQTRYGNGGKKKKVEQFLIQQKEEIQRTFDDAGKTQRRWRHEIFGHFSDFRVIDRRCISIVDEIDECSSRRCATFQTNRAVPSTLPDCQAELGFPRYIVRFRRCAVSL